MLLNLISFLLLFSSSIQCAPISNTTQTIYDVIIVGAGLTGLTAARTIQQNRPDLTVLVIEGRGQVGGRVRYSTMQTRNGVEFIDIGSQFISPNDNLLLEILNEIQIDVKQQLTCGKNSLFEERKKRNIKNVTESNWIKNNFDELLISDELKSLTNISISQFAEGLEISEADSINRLMQTFFDAPAEQVSSAQLALTCNSQNATTVEILRRFGHGQSLIANGGMNEVVRRLADGLLIEYNQKIVSINDTSSPTTLKTSKNRLYSARQVILAVPISTLSNIQLIPQPETPFQQFIENYGPTGHAYYFTMTFQRPTWRLNGKSGKVIYTSQNGPLVWLTTFDTTYASSCSNSTTASSSLWGIAHFSYEVPFETRRRLYIQALIYSFRFADFSPLSVSDVSFANDEFAKSTIPTFRLNIPFDTLKYINNFHTIYQNAHISTSDISTITIGTMNGAINAGKSVGRHVLTILSETNSQTNNLLRDIPLETTTQFVYHTSSHYPPSLFQKSLKDEESSSSLIQRDDPSENQQQQNGTFHYETSSQYPSTLQPTTTTMKHFVFGNLEKSNEKIIEPLPISYDNQEIDPNPSNDNNNNSTTFLYKTSSVMPVTENIETTTFIHFSNGNLFETNQIQRDFINGASVPNQVNTNNFEYSTSTHYPILNNNNLIANRENNVTPSSQIVQELHQVSDNAPNSTSLELATKLTSLVHTILQGLRMFTPPKNYKRKQNFDSPSSSIERTFEVQESPTSTTPISEEKFPASWFYEGVDLENKLLKIRAEFNIQIPVAAPQQSPFRTEYRRILTAINIIEEAKLQQDNQIEWMAKSEAMAEMDYHNMIERRKILENKIKELKKEVLTLNANITENTQKAVATVVAIREEDDVDSLEEYTKISRLCDVALTSFNAIHNSIDQIKRNSSILRRKLKVRRKLTAECKIPPGDQQKFEKLSKILQFSTLENLRTITKFN